MALLGLGYGFPQSPGPLLPLRRKPKPTLKFAVFRCSVAEPSSQIIFRTCKNCKTQFDPSLNSPRACRFHTAHFGGYGFVPNGTSGATVAQHHGAAKGSTTIILRIYNGDMRYYSPDLVATNLYDKRFKLNIIHDGEGGNVTVFIDGVQKFRVKDQGQGGLYFKCGVCIG